MNKEEKEAIEELKKFSNLIIEGGIPNSFIVNKLKITFNLIDKQQKDLENLKEVERQICDEELITKDKYQDILKENAELKELIDELAKENEKWIDSGLDYVKRYFKDYIHKDKIRTKIKEFEEEKEENIYGIIDNECIHDHIIKVLKELLN